MAVKFSIRKQGPATPAEKEKTCPAADRTLPTSGGPQHCNSSSQARTATKANHGNTMTTPSNAGGTSTSQIYITSPAAIVTASTTTPTTTPKGNAKARAVASKATAATAAGCTPQATVSVNRCSPVAVRVASPVTSSGVGTTSVCVVPSNGSNSTAVIAGTPGVSTGVSVITTGGGMSTSVASESGTGVSGVAGGSNGGINVIGSTATGTTAGNSVVCGVGASVGGGAVQVVGCQQLQIERGHQGTTTVWTAAGGAFGGAGGVRPEAKVEGGRSTPSLQVRTLTHG